MANRKRGSDKPERKPPRPPADVEVRVGARIRSLRGSLSQVELGQRIGGGVSQTTILRWESGHGLTLENLERIAVALGLPLPSLVSDVDLEDLRAIGLVQPEKAAS